MHHVLATFEPIACELDYYLGTLIALKSPSYSVRLSPSPCASDCGTGLGVTDEHNGSSPYINALGLEGLPRPTMVGRWRRPTREFLSPWLCATETT